MFPLLVPPSRLAYAWGGHYNVNRNYTANGLNQYSAAGGTAFTYDANGNLTSGGGTSYTYDVENRLVTAGGAHSARLSYDPLGRLWQVAGGGNTTRFLYDEPPGRLGPPRTEPDPRSNPPSP